MFVVEELERDLAPLEPVLLHYFVEIEGVFSPWQSIIQQPVLGCEGSIQSIICGFRDRSGPGLLGDSCARGCGVRLSSGGHNASVKTNDE